MARRKREPMSEEKKTKKIRGNLGETEIEVPQELYKSGGMINFLSFLFFCKLKKDKIGHTI